MNTIIYYIENAATHEIEPFEKEQINRLVEMGIIRPDGWTVSGGREVHFYVKA